MANTAKKVPVTTEEKTSKAPALSEPWHPLDNLRRQIDHLFEDFNRMPLRFPFSRSSAFEIEPNCRAWMRRTSRSSCPTAT